MRDKSEQDTADAAAENTDDAAGTADTVDTATDPAATNQCPVIMRSVHKRFGKQEVLRDIDLDLVPGRITGLLGPSGCGKTTLVGLIVGSLVATSGTVKVAGKPAPPREARRDLGFMPQSDALYNDLTAQENLRFFGTLYGLGRRQLSTAIPRVLGLVQLEDQGRKLVASFSGGMKRRLSLAVALLHQPGLLVLDEPTVGLDPKHRVKLWRSFRAMAEAGTTMLITTHVMEEAAGCDCLMMMNGGRIIAQGPPSDIMKRAGADTLEEAFLTLEASADEAGKGSIHPSEKGAGNA